MFNAFNKDNKFKITEINDNNYNMEMATENKFLSNKLSDKNLQILG